MKKPVLIAACAAAVSLTLGLAGCADDVYYHRHHDRYDVDADYDIFYDNFYGPFSDGYWGDDNYFYYLDSNRRWVRDEGHHFRRDAADGYSPFHYHHHHTDHM